MVRLSVIIPTLNEEKYIKKTLESIKNQDYKDYEVILADSNSSDSTRRIASGIIPNIRLVIKKRRGVGIACNAAAKIAKGDILLFIDADTSITKELMQSYDKTFKERNVVAATGPIVPLERVSPTMRLGYRIVSVYIIKFLLKLGSHSIIGSNFAVSREAFFKAGGFRTDINTYYDWDLSHKLGRMGKVNFVDNAVARTSVRRIRQWGVLHYTLYHTGNTLRYGIFNKVSRDYEPIR